IKGATALRNRVPRAWLKQARRARTILRRTRPKYAQLTFEPLVRNARVIGNSSGRRSPQFVEDFSWRCKCKTPFALQRFRDALNHPPILPGFAGTLDRLVDLDDSSLGRGDNAFILFMKRARQHNVCLAGALIEKEINGDIKIELAEHARHELIVRQRYHR